MSFDKLKLEELQKAAHLFEIPVTEEDTRKEIILKLQESGKTYAMYKRFEEPVEKNSTEQVEFSSTILLKMNRLNPSFEVFGYKFTKSHPYQVMSQKDAQTIMDTYDGFVIATPDEVKSFYN
jgi:hypothetical protein